MKLYAVLTSIQHGFRHATKDFGASESSQFTAMIKDFLIRLGTSVGIISIPVVFVDTIGYPASVVGSSMEPTLHGKEEKWWKRDIVWLSRFGLEKPQIGQVFTFIPPNNPQKRHIKRVIAVDGNIIRPRKSSTFVEVPVGHCWMESDNPTNHCDSSLYGPVSKGLLTARATHIIWPPRRWSAIKTEVFEHSTVPISKRHSLFGLRLPW